MFYQHATMITELLGAWRGWSSVLLLLIFMAGRAILRGDWDEREAQLKAGLVASLVSMAVFSIFDFNLHVPSNAILFSLIAGMAVALGRLQRTPSPRKGIIRERSA
jgi:hypothetical protein